MRACNACGKEMEPDMLCCLACGNLVSDRPSPPPSSPDQPAAAAPEAGPAPVPKRGRGQRTMLAAQALDLADTFRIVLGAPFAGWQAELSDPGMSTGGGRQARQHIGLTRTGGSGTLVAGTVDRNANSAQLRPYARMAAMHEQRFGSHFGVSPSEYSAFVSKAGKFFQEGGLSVTIERDSGDRPSSVPQASRRSGLLVVALVVVVLAVLAGVGWLLVRSGTVAGASAPAVAPGPGATPTSLPPTEGAAHP